MDKDTVLRFNNTLYLYGKIFKMDYTQAFSYISRALQIIHNGYQKLSRAGQLLAAHQVVVCTDYLSLQRQQLELYHMRPYTTVGFNVLLSPKLLYVQALGCISRGDGENIQQAEKYLRQSMNLPQIYGISELDCAGHRPSLVGTLASLYLLQQKPSRTIEVLVLNLLVFKQLNVEQKQITIMLLLRATNMLVHNLIHPPVEINFQFYIQELQQNPAAPFWRAIPTPTSGCDCLEGLLTAVLNDNTAACIRYNSIIDPCELELRLTQFAATLGDHNPMAQSQKNLVKHINRQFMAQHDVSTQYQHFFIPNKLFKQSTLDAIHKKSAELKKLNPDAAQDQKAVSIANLVDYVTSIQHQYQVQMPPAKLEQWFGFVAQQDCEQRLSGNIGKAPNEFISEQMRACRRIDSQLPMPQQCPEQTMEIVAANESIQQHYKNVVLTNVQKNEQNLNPYRILLQEGSQRQQQYLGGRINQAAAGAVLRDQVHQIEQGAIKPPSKDKNIRERTVQEKLSNQALIASLKYLNGPHNYNLTGVVDTELDIKAPHDGFNHRITDANLYNEITHKIVSMVTTKTVQDNFEHVYYDKSRVVAPERQSLEMLDLTSIPIKEDRCTCIDSFQNDIPNDTDAQNDRQPSLRDYSILLKYKQWELSKNISNDLGELYGTHQQQTASSPQLAHIVDFDKLEKKFQKLNQTRLAAVKEKLRDRARQRLEKYQKFEMYSELPRATDCQKYKRMRRQAAIFNYQ